MARPRVSGPLARNHDAPYPGRPFRVYFALTNACDRACPWCSTYSRRGAATYLSEGVFERNLPARGLFEIQLEGGEPLLHPRLTRLVDVARSTGRLVRTVLSTNGARLPVCAARGRPGRLDERRTVESLGRFFARFPGPFTLKLSMNHHLLDADPVALERAGLARIALAALRAPGQTTGTFVLNVRLRKGRANADDAPVVAAVRAAGLEGDANVFFLERYGLARRRRSWEAPRLVGTNFALVAPDGSSHGIDLVARSEAMRRLP